MQTPAPQRVASRHRLLSTIGWRIQGHSHYMLEGSVFIAGALVQWLRDGLGLVEPAAGIEAPGPSVPGRDGAFDIYSLGADGAPGGENENADIYGE